MRSLVDALCSEATAGRAPGTAEGLAARAVVVAALRDAGLDPVEQAIDAIGGANVLATIPGDVDRWVLLAAHYDHLGKIGDDVFWGAGDNAAAVAILVEVARRLVAERAAGRGVVIASFDAEEPPHFLGNTMGSMRYAREPLVPLERTDMMVCMDLVGHAMGPAYLPDSVRNTVFALGPEKSTGTAELVRDVAVDGVVIRPADADLVPPLSDYHAFYRRQVPFLFLTSGRSRHYHAPTDTPDTLDYAKMAATVDWLEAFTRRACERDAPIEFVRRTDDRATLDSVLDMLEPLRALSPEAEAAVAMARELRDACDAGGALPRERSAEATALVIGIEQALA